MGDSMIGGQHQVAFPFRAPVPRPNISSHAWMLDGLKGAAQKDILFDNLDKICNA